MSATRPRRCRCSGRGRMASRRRSTTRPVASATSSSGYDCASRPEAPRVLAGMLDHLDAGGPVRAAQDGDRRAPDRRQGAARQDRRWRRRSGSTSRRSRKSGTASAALSPTLFAWAEGRAAQPAAADVPVFRPFMLAHRARGRAGSRSTIMRPSGNGTASASSSSMPAARPGSTAAPATTSPAAFPTSRRLSHARACSTASCWCGRGAGRRRTWRRRAASFNALQQRLGRKAVSGKMLADYPAFVRLYDILFDGDGGSAASCRGPSGASGSKPSPRRSIPNGSMSRALIEADRLRGARGDPRRRARCRDRRRDAQAPRQPLCRRPPRRPVVQMEARPADRRLRADVRAARQRQAIDLIIPIIRSAAGPRTANCCRSARPISASPTRS